MTNKKKRSSRKRMESRRTNRMQLKQAKAAQAQAKWEALAARLARMFG